MKAYHVYDVNMSSESQEILFAETSGKAKQSSEIAGMFDFIDIRAVRKPQFDQYAELGFVPKQALLEDGWWFECYSRKPACFKHITIEDDYVIVDEHVYCSEHVSKEDGE